MSYAVSAKRWEHGWELHIDGVGVTQSHTLADAEDMVRDYLECMDYADAAEAEVVVTPDLGSLNDEIRQARQATKDAEDAQRKAAAASRRVVTSLRSKGLSVRDTARTLGVSPGRVSQLAAKAGQKDKMR